MKQGRNDPCLCGSGKKYKQCRLKMEQPAELPAEELAWRRVRRELDALSTALSNFLTRTYDESVFQQTWNDFFGDDEETYDAEALSPLFISWLLYFWSPDADELEPSATSASAPAAAKYLSQSSRRIGDIARRYIEAALRAPLTFVEVLAVDPGRSLRVRDVFTGAESTVLDHATSSEVLALDILLVIPVSCEGIMIFEAVAPTPLPPDFKIELIEMREHYGFGPDTTAAQLRELDLEIVGTYLELEDRFNNPELPELRNTDDEPLKLQTLIFNTDSADGVFNALCDLDENLTVADQHALVKRNAAGELEQATIRWTGPGNANLNAPKSVLRGRINITREQLEIDVNSDERATAIQQVVASRLGDAARFRETRTASLSDEAADDMMEVALEEPEGSDDTPVSPEIETELREHYANYYAQWLSTPIPALDGSTPETAIATPVGREKVAALIAGIERYSLGEPGFDPAIVRDLRDRLGLDV